MKRVTRMNPRIQGSTWATYSLTGIQLHPSFTRCCFLSTELNSWDRDCMALKTEKVYLALYRKCLWPLNGIQTVGGTVGRIQELVEREKGLDRRMHRPYRMGVWKIGLSMVTKKNREKGM